MKKFKGQCITANFETGLCTFNMEDNYEVSGREYVIIPVEEYEKIHDDLIGPILNIQIMVNSNNSQDLTDDHLDSISLYTEDIRSIIHNLIHFS